MYSSSVVKTTKLKCVCLLDCVKVMSMQHMEGHLCVLMGSRDGAVVRALASHRCGSGSILELDTICGLSFLLVLFSAPRGFLRVLQFSPLLKNQHFQILIRSRFQWTNSHYMDCLLYTSDAADE